MYIIYHIPLTPEILQGAPPPPAWCWLSRRPPLTCTWCRDSVARSPAPGPGSPWTRRPAATPASGWPPWPPTPATSSVLSTAHTNPNPHSRYTLFQMVRTRFSFIEFKYLLHRHSQNPYDKMYISGVPGTAPIITSVRQLPRLNINITFEKPSLPNGKM